MFYSKTVLPIIAFSLAVAFAPLNIARAGVSISINSGGYHPRPLYNTNPYRPESQYYYNRYGQRYLRNPPDYQYRYGRRYAYQYRPRYVQPYMIEGNYRYRTYRRLHRAFNRYRRFSGNHH